MTTLEAKTITLKDVLDSGIPTADNFEIKTSTVDLSTLEENDIAIQAHFFSADPYLRGTIKSTGSVKAGAPILGFIGGKIIASKNPAWQVGDLLGAAASFSTVQIIPAKYLPMTAIWKLTGLIEESELSLAIGVLGMPGSTAYGGLIDVLRPVQGETIFISAASGAVGSLVGMLAKQLYGCTVIGSCGGPAKCDLVRESFGFDHVIDYKTVSSAAELTERLRAVAPDGIDMYFENVGGIHFEAAMNTLRPGGRVAVCGQISEYNSASPEPCTFQPLKMIYSAQRIEGFVCTPWLLGKKGSFLSDMHKWLREGKVRPQETFYEGIEAWPEGFHALFTGANVGKVVVRI